MADFTISEGDLLPLISAVLTDAAGVPVSLAAATVKFHMALPGAMAKIDATAVIDNAAAGAVHYVWTTGDTDTPGTYVAEWEVIYTSGSKPLTFPNTTTKISVLVTNQIA